MHTSKFRQIGIRQVRIATEIVGLIVAAVFLGYLLQRLHHANLSVLFLLVALIIATRHGLWPSIITSVLGFLAFNFFFTSPYGTFLVTEDGDIATLVFFLAVAILAGNLASRMRTAIRRRDHALERISNLYDFSHRIAGASTNDEILNTLVDHLSATLDSDVAVIDIPNAENSKDFLAINIGLPGKPTAKLSIPRAVLTTEQKELVHNLCGQAKVAFDRIRLSDDLDSSRREAERARLRSALLTSVSHDLRTPLASIIGAASSLREIGDSIDAADRTELLSTVISEARRLNGYIQNLLDMTRIEHDGLRIERDWEEPSDIVDAAVRRVKESWPDAQVSARVLRDTGLVHLHGELFVQALHNVIDNAIRYSPDGVPLSIVCSRSGDAFQVEVTDTGPGLGANERELIFDMFYRAESGDSRSGGTGLGLAITRGILEAHGGKAFAELGPGGRGTRIVLQLPGALSGDGAHGQ